MTYEDTDNMEYQSLYRLVKSLITQIPDNCYLYIGPDIYRLIDEEVCLDFLDFGVALDNDYEWYCERFSLSQQCKEYLLSEDNFLIMMYYFCHYMIRDEDKIYVVVFDGCHFDIDASIRIPREVIDECERELEMDFSFSDPVRL